MEIWPEEDGQRRVAERPPRHKVEIHPSRGGTNSQTHYAPDSHRGVEVLSDRIFHNPSWALEIDPELGYELWTEEDAAPANPSAVKPLPLGVAIAALAALVAGAILAYRRVAQPAVLQPQHEYPPSLPQELPSGLGGWLVLVAIGLVVRPLVGIGALRQTAPMLAVGAWDAFASPGSPQYHPLWSTLMLFELVANSALVTANILLLVFFFQRRRIFPQAFIFLLIAHAAIALADFALGKAVFGPGASGSSPPQVFAMAVTGGLWITYMLRSTRVKLTFTR
jgi:hypothetical protein